MRLDKAHGQVIASNIKLKQELQLFSHCYERELAELVMGQEQSLQPMESKAFQWKGSEEVVWQVQYAETGKAAKYREMDLGQSLLR
jgi:hypothetical protein